jgi:hypothetical protein
MHYGAVFSRLRREKTALIIVYLGFTIPFEVLLKGYHALP